MQPIPFVKMHGAGNDFIVIDRRKFAADIRGLNLVRIADRHFGIGCDQIVIIEPSTKADVFMRIYNSDGGEVSSCGNASRCVAWQVMQETGKKTMSIETLAGVLSCSYAGDQLVTVDMGAPRFGWQDIPLSEQRDTLNLGSFFEPHHVFEQLAEPAAVSMGNPHIIFFVSDVARVHLTHAGPLLEHHPLFPERANIEAAQVLDKSRIRLRVWERGAGETLACGTGACATAVAACRRGLTGRKVDVMLPGGTLHIEWLGDNDNGHVMMTGPVASSFYSHIDPKVYAA